MSDIHKHALYVAPPEPPASRRPPATEVGLIGWLKHNLFSSLTDTVRTLVMAGLLGWFIYGFLDWAITDAQWEVVFLNLKTIGTGPEFPADQVWRINTWAFVLIFLIALSMGFWSRIVRWIWGILLAIGAALILVPLIAQTVDEPTIYYYADPDYVIREVQFVADAGEEMTFRLNPATSPEDFNLERFQGYIANDTQFGNTSWDKLSEMTRLVSTGALDPAQFDLKMAVQVWDRDGEVIAESAYTDGAAESIEVDWEAPDSGWYTVTIVRAAETPGEQGIVFLEVENLESYVSTARASNARLEKYGEKPEPICPNCGVEPNRTDLRFSGERSFMEWLSLQVAPYFLEIREFFFIALASAFAGYMVGQVGKQILPEKRMSRFIVSLWLLSVPLQFVLIQGGSFSYRRITINLETIDSGDYGGIFLTILMASVAIVASFPLGVGLALGRQSDLPVISILCTLFIEVMRGVPLITLLFMGRFILAFVADALTDVDMVIRMTIMMTLFTAAYLAEVVRGGLQIVNKGQVEAAKALGLNAVYTTNLIVLPQALRAVIPAIMGQFISLFKDTSLVALVGLYEVTGAMRILLSNTLVGYSALQREGYLYIGIIYFIFCYLMAEASRRLETSGAGAIRRDTI